MGNEFAKLLLLTLAIAYVVWDCLTTKQQFTDRPNREELRQALFTPAFVMTLSLAANGLAFMQEAYTLHEFGFIENSSWFALWRDRYAILVGTGLLFEIVRRALTMPIPADDPPLVAGLRVQISMYRRLFKQHLFATLGIGTVFGIASGRDISMLLGIELALMWAGSAFLLHRTLAQQKSGDR